MWWGKIIGAALGLYRGGPAGLLLGLLVGHMVDRAVAKWLGKARSGARRRKQAPARSGQLSLASAYQALGVRPDASDADIKRAYRKAMSDYHPDRLRARGQPESARAAATAKVQQLQAAYDHIRQARKRRSDSG